MQVILINIPDQNSLDSRLDSPLGLMYLSATLKQNNIKCKIIDLCFHDKSEWLSIIQKNPADLYGMTIYSANVYSAYAVTQLIKSVHPQSKVVWGGPHSTFCSVDIATNYPDVDFVVFGEGEETLLGLCKGFNNCNYDTISGLANRKGNAFFISNMRPLIKNIDDIPMPDRIGIPIHDYTRTVDGIQSCAITTSRGCAYNCKFCCSKYYWQYPRFHSVERVVLELCSIYEMGFKAFHCWDDTFTLHKHRLERILNEVKKMDFVFRCNGNLRLDTKKTLQKLYDAGCREYGVGIESGDQKVLDAINKGTTVERNKQVLKWAKEVGLPVKAYIMCGNPSESWASIQKTIDFIKETGPEYYTLSNMVPLPGSEFFHHPEKYGIKFRTKDWSEYFVIGRQNEGGCVIDTDVMTAEEIAEARKMILKELPKQTGKLQNYYKRVKK